ncbi:TRAP transporter, DctM subunit [Hoeflea sp. IMCC20628]|uniref:TRAP transporter large permease n=1 Tax=Hoeflea sp. IMCC20628 TaxID=1620421 RepID=UPI00063AE2E6|nr:TRAP transporter large permease [Hoeflea sp. IMCC20628]AKI02515.1 TRAP transporter, DctM subunit [Hoeflea sp. IMCC20628]
MTSIEIGLAGLAILFLLIAARVPIGISLIAVSFGGLWALAGPDVALALLGSTPYNFSASWSLSSVPMFLLMGFFCFHAGLTMSLFNAARIWFSRVPGALAVASVVGASGFAAVSGSSVATAAAMGKIAVPEMLRWRYDPSLATGTVAAAGTIGALIPPSIIMILFGVFAEVPVSRLFMGGIVVGLMTGLSYVAVIVIRVLLNPALAPSLPERPSMGEKMAALRSTWPILLIMFCVFGGMFGGLFSATEAGAVGAFLSAIVAAMYGKLTWKNLKSSLYETIVTTSALFIIAIGASLLTRFLAISGAGAFLSDMLVYAGSDPIVLMLIITVIYLLLGMFLEPLGAMLLTLPVILPAVEAGHLDLIWFGVLLVKYLEVGMITPPIGMNVFIIKGVVGDTVKTWDIFRGVAWFLVADVVVISLLILFPDIVLFLPNLMK